MELDGLLAALSRGETITDDSPWHQLMHRTSQEALRITAEWRLPRTGQGP
ncbi:MAG TPA: hypothetical protein VN621_11720 [Arthrobacter sp.]|nr:hypothetical protein [Arthrobacter sp.]